MASSRPDPLRGLRTSLSAARSGLSWLRRKIGTVITTIVVITGATLVATGIPLIWLYEPAGTSVLQQSHQSAGFVLIIVATILALRAAYARLFRKRSHLGWGAAATLAALTLAGGSTGVGIAWDEIHTASHIIFGDLGTGETHTVARPAELIEPGTPVAPSDRDTGTIAATQEGVISIVTDGAPMTPGDYTFVSWSHFALFPILTAVAYAAGRWLHLRRQRPDAPDRGGAEETETDGRDGDDEDRDPAGDERTSDDGGAPDADGDESDRAGPTRRGKRGRTTRVTHSK